MATAAQVASFKAANGVLNDEIGADLDKFWSYLDLSKPDRARNALLNYVPLLVQRYGDVAATIAADWFEELRFDAIEAGTVGRIATSTAKSFTALPAKPVEAVLVESAVRYAAGALFTPTPEDTLATVRYSAQHFVEQTGRATIAQNTFRRGSGAAGWQRVARAGACRFCRALAARGAVYKESTVSFAAHSPTCHCAAVPSFDPHAPEVDVDVYRASKNTSRMSTAQRDKHRAQINAWLDREYPEESGDDADHEHDH